jgi:epoxide hydrolase-like predicted phosphatase
MIKAIIFDFGSVILAARPASVVRGYEEELGLAPGMLHRIMYSHPSWQDVMLGRKDMEAYWTEIGPLLGLHSPAASAAFQQRYWADERLDGDMLDLVRRLNGQYRLAVLSNAPPGLAKWMAQWQILDLFDEVICSGDVGLFKPDPAIFRLMLDRLGVAPHEAIFVDDRPEHVEAARSLGILGIQFTSAAVLVAALDDLLSSNGAR